MGWILGVTEAVRPEHPRPATAPVCLLGGLGIVLIHT